MRFLDEEQMKGLVPELVSKLDTFTKIIGYAPRITFTTNGVHSTNSSHYKGMAVDIGLGHLADGFERNTQRYKMLKAAFLAGFERIEDAERHIHLCVGKPPEYPTPTFWIGKDA